MKREPSPWWTAGKNNLTNSSKFFFPLTVTKQEPKNNKDCRQKPHALCFREQRCHDSVFFCQRSVTANAKGLGPLRYKGQNQWSFGKTDGKPLADRWVGRRRAEELCGGGRPSLSRHHHRQQRWLLRPCLRCCPTSNKRASGPATARSILLLPRNHFRARETSQNVTVVPIKTSTHTLVTGWSPVLRYIVLKSQFQEH